MTGPSHLHEERHRGVCGEPWSSHTSCCRQCPFAVEPHKPDCPTLSESVTPIRPDSIMPDGPCTECGLIGRHRMQCSARPDGARLVLPATSLPDGSLRVNDVRG